MTDPCDDFERRARIAAAELRRAVAVQPPDLDELVTVSRISRIARVVLAIAALVAMGAVAFALATVADPAGVRGGTAAILLVLLVATGVLGAHAGGHAWLVPLPALALAVVWAFTASERSAEAAWWLVALCAIGCAGGILLAAAALRQRLRGTLVGLPELRGMTGVAVTPLEPAGVVRVGGEKWSAKSVSGPLQAGAPVHVLGVRGVRLYVWSELGTVPDHTMLATEEDKP
jgi:membrane-bound ClpP family serine protease